MRSNSPSPYPDLLIILFGLVVINIYLALVPQYVSLMLVRENGLVEILSVVAYLFAVILLFRKTAVEKVPYGYSSSFLLLLFAMRELDFHKRFTTMGTFKTKYYLSNSVPIVEKIVVVCIMLSLVVFTLMYLKKNVPSFLKKVRAKVGYCIIVAIAICSMFFSKFMDSYSEPLKKVFAYFYGNPDHLSRIIEETAELAIPVLFILAIVYYEKPEERIT